MLKKSWKLWYSLMGSKTIPKSIDIQTLSVDEIRFWEDKQLGTQH